MAMAASVHRRPHTPHTPCLLVEVQEQAHGAHREHPVCLVQANLGQGTSYLTDSWPERQIVHRWEERHARTRPPVGHAEEEQKLGPAGGTSNLHGWTITAWGARPSC